MRSVGKPLSSRFFGRYMIYSMQGEPYYIKFFLKLQAPCRFPANPPPLWGLPAKTFVRHERVCGQCAASIDIFCRLQCLLWPRRPAWMLPLQPCLYP